MTHSSINDSNLRDMSAFPQRLFGIHSADAGEAVIITNVRWIHTLGLKTTLFVARINKNWDFVSCTTIGPNKMLIFGEECHVIEAYSEKLLTRVLTNIHTEC